MKTPPRILLAVAVAMLANPSAFAAAPQVEETILGPTDAGGIYTVSLSGAHAAYMGKKGARFFMRVDGLEGPEFDEIYKAAGGSAFFPQKAGVWLGTLGGLEGHDAPVLFSRDGAHYAYAGTQGADYVVIHDGKEIGRAPWELMGRRGLTMSPGGRHVYWHEAKMEQGRTIARPVVTGKPGPWTTGQVSVVFSPDDLHYAYYVPQTIESGKPVLIVDDKDAGYAGQQPVFTADGSVLLTTKPDAQGNVAVLANGKPATTGFTAGKVITAAVGRRWAAIGRKSGSRPLDGNTLFLDGEHVPDSNHVENVWFSPDGTRYAAVCHNGFDNSFAMIIDGEAYAFSRIDAQAPYWTPDSSKIIFTAGTDSGSFVVVNDDMFPYSRSLSAVTLSEGGHRYAWGTVGNAGGGYSVIVDGQPALPAGLYPTSNFIFSPDGSRYGFTVGPVGRNDTTGLVIDGVLQPGIVPGFLAKWMSTQLSVLTPLAFSRDGKHVAYMGRTAGAQANSLYVDGTLVQPNVSTAIFPTFTPDSQHFFWAVQEAPYVTVVYVDGEPAVRANGYFFTEIPGSFDMDAKGVATFLAADGDAVKRYRITAPPDTSVETLLARGMKTVPAAPTAAVTQPPPAAPKPPAPAAKAPAPASSAPAVALTWNDLVRRPEARPTTCTVNRAYQFQGGATVRAGTRVNILEVRPSELVVGTTDGRTNFGIKPEETDILAVASAAWSQLTPAQRELTYPALLQRMDLWPYRLKLALPFELEGRKTRVGDPAILLGSEGNQLFVRLEGTDIAFNVELDQTDLMTQARALLADVRGAPGRVLEEFAGKLVSPIDGRQVALDANARPKHVVMYMGAGWCAPCQTFSPQLVKVLKDKAPKPADVTVIYLSGDKSPAEAKGYVTKLGVDWPTLYFKNRGQLPAFGPLFGNVIPQLVVTDRHGKVVINSSTVGYDRALAQLRDLL